jgi:hypothetical protein
MLNVSEVHIAFILKVKEGSKQKSTRSSQNAIGLSFDAEVSGDIYLRCLALSEAHGVTAQNTAFFIATSV